MKLHIIRLGSVVPGGVGGSEAGAIDLIYTFLLQEYESDVYSHIHINQIGDDLQEMIMKEGKKIHINIRYPVNDFDNKDSKQKNLIRLDVVHTALMRIAEKEEKLDKAILHQIRNRIIENNFEFDFLYKQYENKKNKLTGKILIHPRHDKFCFYFTAEKNGELLCKIPVYEGKCTDFYIPAIFYTGKWKTQNEFIIKDGRKEVELHVFIKENRVELVNLTKYKNPPFYEMMKAGGPNEEAYKDWLHSLPPGVAGTISYEPN